MNVGDIGNERRGGVEEEGRHGDVCEVKEVRLVNVGGRFKSCLWPMPCLVFEVVGQRFPW